jgi:hypothetical protein
MLYSPVSRPWPARGIIGMSIAYGSAIITPALAEMTGIIGTSSAGSSERNGTTIGMP